MASVNKKIDLYWFSGTGNTLWVSKRFSEEMRKYDFEINLIPLPCPPPQNIPSGKMLAIAFPVYAQTVPGFVHEWIKTLPDNPEGMPVIIISTLAGFSGLVKGPLFYLLKKKGYTPLAIKEIIMPSNYICVSTDENKNSKIREKAKNNIANFAKEIAAGHAKWFTRRSARARLSALRDFANGERFSEGGNHHEWPYRPILLNLFQYLCEKIFILVAGWLGKGFYANNKRCSQCGLCVTLCPLNNIHMEKGKLPQWDKKCQQCLRCINFCPVNAITNKFSFIFNQKYKADNIKASDLLKN